MSIFYTRPGVTSYGHRLGILQLDCNQPFIPGDVGNAQTWDFPVLYEVVPGCSIERLIVDNDPALQNDILQKALLLQSRGVEAITSNCGFMIRHQHAVEQALDIPVFLSSLLELPHIQQNLNDRQTIAVITASANALRKEDLSFIDLHKDHNIHIYGMEEFKAFAEPFLKDCGYVDIKAMEDACAYLARKVHHDHPDLGAILLECAVLPPYAQIFAKEVKVPVHSFTTMVRRRMRE